LTSTGPTTFTIGHSTHEPDAFVRLLRAFDLEIVVDVRRYPGSRRLPWTNAPELERLLPIDYLHLGELGGRRRPSADSPNDHWENDGFRGYADHMASAEFASGFDRLCRFARRRRVVVMCAEALWWRCHRRLIADALLVHDFEVRHIDARGNASPHRLTEQAVVEDGRLVYPPAQGRLDVE
jgi:uncharacterized protein (DUF488 family)